MVNGAFTSTSGSGTWRITSSNSGVMSLRSPSSESVAQPWRPEAKEGREIQLLLGRIERREQVENLVVHAVRLAIRAVDLVDDDDRLQAAAQRLAQHELRLRQHALGGIDQQQHAIDHR